ncbi:MAG: hypothetical protein JW863_19390 [Chitinispirillaceae bacterium]|nr:hypothetical protein [Chitinispirillaceae bacterium]
MSNVEHLGFLKSFPHLSDWLNCNGYSLIYSHKDEYDQIHTMWSDRSSAPLEDGTTDAKEWLVVTYCEQCKVIDVYKRVAICGLGDDERLTETLSAALSSEDEDSVINRFDDEHDLSELL